MKNKKFLSIVLTASMFLGTVGTTMTAFAQEGGVFDNPLQTIQKKPYSKEKFTAKPLVILIDFPDYKFTELDEREKKFRINDFKGKETTPEFYQELFFGDNTYKTSDGRDHITVKKFFMEESGGTYEFDGKVVGWYTADKNAEEYGKNDSQWENDQPRARELVKEAIEKASKDLDLSEFDVEDKWDLNGNGNYNEPDGIIDSLVVIHPGLGEEWGGGSLGEDAIWPFRWGFNMYAYGEELDMLSLKEKQDVAKKNPQVTDKNGNKYLIEDFTVFEQDLPVDLFCHEFGHVLGLPDLYDVRNWSEVPVENWSIMGGSYTGNPRGSQPNSYGAYCKEFFQEDFLKRGRKPNWQNSKKLNLEEITEEGLDIVLDQASLKGNNHDCIRIDLPEYYSKLPAQPKYGKKFFFSGCDNNLENYMTTKKPLDLTNAKAPKMSINAWYDLDPDFDFASVQVKVEGTDEWVCIKDLNNLQTDKVDQWVVDNETKEEILHRNPGWGFTDKIDTWTDISFDLSAYKGKKIDLRFRLATDSNGPYSGFYFDNLKVTDGENVIFQDDAEGEEKFDFKGFSMSDGTEPHTHRYLLEWRNKDNGLVDQGLGTINIGRPGLQYDAGLVIWYINDKYEEFKPDQDVSAHPGEACVTIVDANQDPVMYKYADGRSGADKMNYQLHDAAFSLRPGSKLEINGGEGEKAYTIKDNNTFMNPVFNDKNDYTGDYGNGITGVKLQQYGLKVFVTEESKDRSTAKIHIAREVDGSKSKVQEQDLIKMIKAENGKLFVTPKAEYGDKAYAEYVNDKNEKKQLTLEYKDGKYVADAAFLAGNNSWKLSHVIFIDKEGNAKAIYNNEVHKLFGADLSETGDVASVKMKITNKAEEFIKGKTVNIKSDIKINKEDVNNAKVEKVKLLVGVYDKNDKLVSFAVKEVTVGETGDVLANADIEIPKEDNLKVKVFLWESSPSLRPLQRAVTYDVK